MQIIDCQQRTDEWYEARLGIPTASQFDKIITTSGKQSTQRKKYMYKLIGEYLSGMPEETYQNHEMLRGIELEEEARQVYEGLTGNFVDEVGFIRKVNCGCSPDGLIADDGCLEIKCPSLSVHIEYLHKKKLPTKYVQQVQGQIYVTGREWCDFVSYYPNVKPLIVRVPPDEKLIQCLEIEIDKFNQEMETILKDLS